MAQPTYTFRTEIWQHEGPGGWWFASLPEDDADEIDERVGDRAKGFGSVPVEVTIGSSTWRTSIFPDTKRATYLLPVKKAVRTKERLADGATPEIVLRLLLDV